MLDNELLYKPCSVKGEQPANTHGSASSGYPHKCECVHNAHIAHAHFCICGKRILPTVVSK